MFGFGVGELLIILCIILLLFGARKLPEIAKSLGSSIKEFRKAGKEVEDVSEKESEKAETRKLGGS